MSRDMPFGEKFGCQHSMAHPWKPF